MAATRRQRATVESEPGRWAVGLLIVALGALLLWAGLRLRGDDVDTAADVANTAPAAGGEMVPLDDVPAEAPPPLPDRTMTDVIPPQDP